MAPLFAYLNGIQRHPYCRPIGGPVGFDPRRQRIDHTAFVACAVGDTHHHGTRRKAQDRLASAGSMLTAVALELVAGKTWAAGLTRKPGAGLDRYSTTRGFQLEEPPAAFGRRGRLGCPTGHGIPHGLDGRDSRDWGRGHRLRVGPPLGHPGPEAGRQIRTKRSTWSQSWPVARGPLRRNRDGKTSPGGWITPEARAPGWSHIRSPVRAEPMCARGTETLRTCPAWTRIWIGTGNSSPRPGPRGKPMCATRRRPADRLGRDQSYCLHHGPDGR